MAAHQVELLQQQVYPVLAVLGRVLPVVQVVAWEVRLWQMFQALRLAIPELLQAVGNGFENEVSFTQLTQNGTFFNNMDIVPTFGYSNSMEIGDKNKRIKLKLPPRLRMSKLNENDLKTRANTYISSDADWVE